MKLVLKDKIFVLKSAKLSASIPDPYWLKMYHPAGDGRLSWSLDLQTEPETTGEKWAPRVYNECMQLPLRRWTDFSGQVVTWSEPFDDESGEQNGGFYVVEHGEISRARISLLERDGVTFRFEWEGLCDVFWGEDYGQDVPFTASGRIEFTGITVRGSESDTDESLRNRLAEYLDLRDLEQGLLQRDGHSYQSGVKMVHAVFTPREKVVD